MLFSFRTTRMVTRRRIQIETLLYGGYIWRSLDYSGPTFSAKFHVRSILFRPEDAAGGDLIGNCV